MLRRGLVLDLSVAFGESTMSITSIAACPILRRESSISVRHGLIYRSTPRRGTVRAIREEPMADCKYDNRSGDKFRVLLLVRYVHEDSAYSVKNISRSIGCIDEGAGYHIPAVRTRDRFYAKLEDDRAEAAGA